MAKRYVVETGHERYKNEYGEEQERDYQKAVLLNTAEDPFYITFLNYVGWMYDIRGNVALNVMACLMEMAEFNTGVVNLSPAMRRKIKEKVGIADSALSRAINVLVEKQALASTTYLDKETGEMKKSRGEYLINPQMFWKGELAKRKKLLVIFQAVYEDGTVPPTFTSTSTDGIDDMEL